MQAKFYDEQARELQETEVQEAPITISSLYKGSTIPFLWKGKLYACTYEREINSLFIQYEITNSQIYRLVAERIAKINADALKEAAEKAERLIMQVTRDLENIAPPWFE